MEVWREELYHHGILGMRWGKRNGPPYPLGTSQKSSAEKKAVSQKSLKGNKSNHKIARDVKRAAKIAGYVTLGTVTAVSVMYAYKATHTGGIKNSAVLAKIPIKNFQKMGKDQVLIKRGQIELQRIVRSTDNSLAKEKMKDVIFATADKNDNNFFKFGFVARGEGTKYITKREVLNDLYGPSARKRVLTFMQLANNNSEFRDALSKELSMTKTPIDIDKKNLRKYYSSFANALAKNDSKAGKIYFDKLRELGYNALVDDEDAGGIAKAPLILLDAQKDSRIISAKKATSADFLSALLLYKPFK